MKALLLKAAELVEERGHNQGWYEGDNGSLCILGALEVASGEEPFSMSEILLPLHHGCGLAHDLRPFALGVIRWNDAPGRTKAEVVQALRNAAGYLP